MSDICAVGVDLGSATVKAVGVDENGKSLWRSIEPAEPHIEKQAVRMLARARERAADPAWLPAVATGYGRKLIAQHAGVVTEITCHARGVFHRLSQAGTLIDIGGQDSKVIALGPTGKVANFTMNDKCAAGTGRFLEVSAARLHIPIERIGQVALDATGEVAISSTCTVFAETEIVSLIARGQPVDRIVRGLHRALVSRVVALVNSIRPKPPLMLSGGVALNPAVPTFLAEALGHPVQPPDEPQLMGALGAALIALEREPPPDSGS